MEPLLSDFQSMSLDVSLEPLEQAFNAWTLGDLSPIPQQHSRSVPDSPVLTIRRDTAHGSLQTSPNLHSHQVASNSLGTAVILANTGGSILDCLWLFDEQLDSHMKVVVLDLDALGSPDESEQAKVVT